MEPNILLKEAPSAVMVDGVSVPINSDWRTGIRVLMAVDDPALGGQAKGRAILELYYSRNGLISQVVVNNAEEAINQAISFLNFHEPKKPKVLGVGRRKSLLRDWDWSYDAHRVISDFQREYTIDLTDPSLDMHWWRFYSLWKNLSDTSQTMHAISLRGASVEQGMSAEAKAKLKRMQAEVLLPARTEEEAMNLTNFKWGL